jgi:hypothetical protein
MRADAGCNQTKDEEKLVYVHFCSQNVSDIFMHSIPVGDS